MGVPVNKFEEFRKDDTNRNINFVDYGETDENQSLGEIEQVSDINRRKKDN